MTNKGESDNFISKNESIEDVMIRYDRAFKGLEVLFEAPFLKDLRKALYKWPEKQVEGAWSRNQITSKKWLCQKVADSINLEEERKIIILGGWYGSLPVVFSHLFPENQCSFFSIDLEPSCQEIAHYINRSTKSFETFTADMTKLDYRSSSIKVKNRDSTDKIIELNHQDLIINTSSEHLEDAGAWFESIKEGQLVCVQNNDMFDGEGHISCVKNLDEFKKLFPMSHLLYEGEFELNSYTRFMRIGRK